MPVMNAIVCLLKKDFWDKPMNGTPMINAPAFHLKKAFILAYNYTTVTNTLAYNSKRLIEHRHIFKCTTMTNAPA